MWNTTSLNPGSRGAYLSSTRELSDSYEACESFSLTSTISRATVDSLQSPSFPEIPISCGNLELLCVSAGAVHSASRGERASPGAATEDTDAVGRLLLLGGQNRPDHTGGEPIHVQL